VSLSAGSRLGVYEILQPISAGGKGEVYRARDTTLGRDVAIKILRQEFALDSDRLKRFEQEARSASALNHPNIIHIYAIGEHEGTRYIAMEHVPGRTLRDVLRDAPLPTAKVLETASQIAAGFRRHTRPGSSIGTSSPRT
jgi:serine/threonine protein kinase